MFLETFEASRTHRRHSAARGTSAKTISFVPPWWHLYHFVKVYSHKYFCLGLFFIKCILVAATRLVNYPGGPQSTFLFTSILARAECWSLCWLMIAALIFISFYLAANLWTVIFIWYVSTKSAIYGVAQRFSRESRYQRGRMNKPFHSASADRRHVCSVYRRKGKDFDVQLCFPWRRNANRQTLKDKNQNRCWSTKNLHLLPGRPGGKLPTLQDLFHLYNLKTKRLVGQTFYVTFSRNNPVFFSFFFLDYILNQSTAFGWKNAHSWHRCAKSGVAMCRSISQNTCQSWQGRKVKKHLLHPEKPPEFFSVLINVKTPLSSELKKIKNKNAAAAVAATPMQISVATSGLPATSCVSSQFARRACSSCRHFRQKKKKRITYCDREAQNYLCHNIN